MGVDSLLCVNIIY